RLLRVLSIWNPAKNANSVLHSSAHLTCRRRCDRRFCAKSEPLSPQHHRSSCYPRILQHRSAIKLPHPSPLTQVVRPLHRHPIIPQPLPLYFHPAMNITRLGGRIVIFDVTLYSSQQNLSPAKTPGIADSIIVSKSAHTLSLMSGKTVLKTYHVAIGCG